MFLHGQNENTVTFYSDKYGLREVPDGPYKKELTQVNDSVLTELFSKTKNGQIIWTKSYLGNQPYGKWKWYDKKGNVELERDYDFTLKYGEFIPTEAISFKELNIDLKSDPNSQIIQRHIVSRFRYPETAQANGIQGKVTVQFTVDKNGNVDNLRILEGKHISLDTECFRIMNSLKKLEPYEKDGEKTMVYYTIPITFRLQ
jgi:protein TonB